MERQVEFKNDRGLTVRGMFFAAEGVEKGPVIIVSHGFNGRYQHTAGHGPVYNLAGIHCLAFAFCGGGVESESDGDMMDMTIGTECRDLEAAIAFVRTLPEVDPEQIFLQGESQGGLVSALVAAGHPELAGVVLWYPAFIIPEAAKKRMASGVHEAFGVPFGEALDREAAEIDVYREIPAYTGPVLIINGDSDFVVPLSAVEKAQAVYENCDLLVIEGAGHGYKPDELEIAREETANFVKNPEGYAL